MESAVGKNAYATRSRGPTALAAARILAPDQRLRVAGLRDLAILIEHVDLQRDDAAVRRTGFALVEHREDRRDRVAGTHWLDELPADFEQRQHGAIHKIGARGKPESHADDHRS